MTDLQRFQALHHKYSCLFFRVQRLAFDYSRETVQMISRGDAFNPAERNERQSRLFALLERLDAYSLELTKRVRTLLAAQ
jgi:hypothetical protein